MAARVTPGKGKHFPGHGFHCGAVHRLLLVVSLVVGSWFPGGRGGRGHHGHPRRPGGSGGRVCFGRHGFRGALSRFDVHVRSTRV